MPDKEPEPQLNRLTIEWVAREAHEITLRHGEHIPTLIIEDSQKRLIFQLPNLAATHDERADQMQEVGFTLAARGEIAVPQQLFFVTEAWMSFQKKGSAPTVPPSQNPGRKEVLFVSQLDVPRRETRVVISEMIRDEQDQLIVIQQLDLGDAPQSQGGHQSPLLDAFVLGVAMALIRHGD